MEDLIDTAEIASPQALIARSVPLDIWHPGLRFRSGVYFLIEAGAIVYVGSSCCMHTRLVSHRSKKRAGSDTRVAWIHADYPENDAIERAYIDALRPSMNRFFGPILDEQVAAHVANVCGVPLA